MLKTLYGKLALLAAFLLMLTFLIYTMDVMFNESDVAATIVRLVFAAVIFALCMGFVVFALLTRRLRHLANAVDAFLTSGFTGPVRIASANANGDEIDRLGYVFEQMEARMVLQLQSLQRVDAQRRELLANVSHDLRTPLASMQGYLETLLIREASLSPMERRNYLEIAARHSERLGKLVGNLFDLTKFDANEIKARPEIFSMRELTQDVAQKFHLPAERKNIQIEVAAGEDALTVEADIGLIERVLENLLENAIRHCPNAAIVRLSFAAADGRVSIMVSDTGHGIPPDELPKLFDRYFRVQRHEQESSASTGLGLAISKRIVELHGGMLEVASRLGEGSIFTFDLPMAPGGKGADSATP